MKYLADYLEPYYLLTARAVGTQELFALRESTFLNGLTRNSVVIPYYPSRIVAQLVDHQVRPLVKLVQELPDSWWAANQLDKQSLQLFAVTSVPKQISISEL